MTNPGSRIWFKKDRHWIVVFCGGKESGFSKSILHGKDIYREQLTMDLIDDKILDLNKITDNDFIVIPARNLKNQ